MKYLYNPVENGAPISNFVFNFNKYEHPVGKILQYEDDVAVEMQTTFGFLQDLSKAEVEQKLEYLKNPFPCEYCEKSFTERIALTGHLNSHKDLIAEKEAPLDPAIIPVAEGKPSNVFMGPNVPRNQRQANPEQVNPDEDLDGNDAFYGPGMQETHGK